MIFGAFSLLWLAGLIVMIWALVDCIRVVDDSQYQSGSKLVWVLVIVLLQGLGGIVYLAIGRPKPRPDGSSPVAPLDQGSGSVPPPPPGSVG